MDQAGLDELLRRAGRREPEALRELVTTYSARVLGLLYRLTGSRDAAEDLCQETFLRVVRVIDRYEHVGKFEPWLFRIAANLARDHARKTERRRESGTPGGEALDDFAGLDSRNLGATSNNPAEHLVRREAGEQLAECLERLPPADREIILLRHYSELPFREIAAMLGIPLGTALARAHRTLKRMREELTQTMD